MLDTPKRLANRANARRSTGPRTPVGKARVSQNAQHHGLAVPVLANEALKGEVDHLAHTILASCGGTSLKLAARVAEAQIDVDRVRRVRHQLISRALQSLSAVAQRGPAEETRPSRH